MLDGRGGEIRTRDLLVPNQALYQAKLHPVLTGMGGWGPVPVNVRVHQDGRRGESGLIGEVGKLHAGMAVATFTSAAG